MINCYLIKPYLKPLFEKKILLSLYIMIDIIIYLILINIKLKRFFYPFYRQKKKIFKS